MRIHVKTWKSYTQFINTRRMSTRVTASTHFVCLCVCVCVCVCVLTSLQVCTTNEPTG